MSEIALRNGGVTLVDEADVEWLSQYSWAGYMMKSGLRYVMTDNSNGRIYMHRLIVGAEPDMEVDHRDNNPLNNQRANLREVTHAQNQQNRRNGYGATGHRNVYRSIEGKFQVKVVVDGKPKSFGSYDTVEEAAVVARRARIAHLPFSDESTTAIEYTGPEWYECPIAPGYFLTKDGRIRNSHGQELSRRSWRKGSCYVSVARDGKPWSARLVRLMAATFPSA